MNTPQHVRDHGLPAGTGGLGEVAAPLTHWPLGTPAQADTGAAHAPSDLPAFLEHPRAVKTPHDRALCD